EQRTRKALARWYERAIYHARTYEKAQEYHNESPDLYQLGMSEPNPSQFLPYLNLFDCSKVSDGAASIVIASEEGLKKLGIPRKKAVEIIALGEAEGDITKAGSDPSELVYAKSAARK